MELKTKIRLGFLCMLIITLVLGFISNNNINQVNQEYTSRIKADIAPLVNVMYVEIAYANVRQTSRGFIIRITSDMSQLEIQSKRLQGLLNIMSEEIDALLKVINNAGTSEAIIAAVNEIKKQYHSDFKPMVEQMMVHAKSGDLQKTVDLLNATNDVSVQIYENIQNIYDLTFTAMEEVAKRNTEATESNFQITIIIVILSLLVCLIGLVWSNSISKSLK